MGKEKYPCCIKEVQKRVYKGEGTTSRHGMFMTPKEVECR